VWLANLAAIELHTPLSRAEAMQRPTALVFDLDPGPPASVIECCLVALQLHGMFENLGLQSFAKTSGSKGLQVYLPLNSDKVTYEQTKPFARSVAELLEGAEPELVVSRMTRVRRTGKVLIDWSQNDQKKTTVCVYSLRATARPPVSTPLEWDEVGSALQSAEPERLVFEARDVLGRVAERGDLFAPVLSLVREQPAPQRDGGTGEPGGDQRGPYADHCADGRGEREGDGQQADRDQPVEARDSPEHRSRNAALLDRRPHDRSRGLQQGEGEAREHQLPQRVGQAIAGDSDGCERPHQIHEGDAPGGEPAAHHHKRAPDRAEAARAKHHPELGAAA